MKALRNSLCSEESEIFGNEELELAASKVLKMFQQNNLPDQDRPQKRQRLHCDLARDDNGKLYDYYVAEVTSRLLDHPKTDLSGLHEVAV